MVGLWYCQGDGSVRVRDFCHGSAEGSAGTAKPIHPSATDISSPCCSQTMAPFGRTEEKDGLKLCQKQSLYHTTLRMLGQVKNASKIIPVLHHFQVAALSGQTHKVKKNRTKQQCPCHKPLRQTKASFGGLTSRKKTEHHGKEPYHPYPLPTPAIKLWHLSRLRRVQDQKKKKEKKGC